MMPRPTIKRIVAKAPAKRGFRPSGASSSAAEEVVLAFDEAEALKLADLEGLYQQAAAQRMGVSRQTFGRIVESARRKTADALLNGKKLRIEGGTIAVKKIMPGPMLVAVPTASRGQVEGHFGRCERLTVYNIGADGAIQAEEIVEATIGPGCRSSVLSRLATMGVGALVVGCIGEGAVRVCAGHGIEVLRGASGSARLAALSYVRGEIQDTGLACGRTCKAMASVCR
jgi:predicted DNA-binding protein (UPF0251 family)/predicted Fe-Mo cluster-binding NifX family protein